MHFIQLNQFSETNVTSLVFQQISDLKIFPECFRGLLKTLWWAMCCPRACSWTTLNYIIEHAATGKSSIDDCTVSFRFFA